MLYEVITLGDLGGPAPPVLIFERTHRISLVLLAPRRKIGPGTQQASDSPLSFGARGRFLSRPRDKIDRRDLTLN